MCENGGHIVPSRWCLHRLPSPADHQHNDLKQKWLESRERKRKRKRKKEKKKQKSPKKGTTQGCTGSGERISERTQVILGLKRPAQPTSRGTQGPMTQFPRKCRGGGGGRRRKHQPNKFLNLDFSQLLSSKTFSICRSHCSLAIGCPYRSFFKHYHSISNSHMILEWDRGKRIQMVLHCVILVNPKILTRLPFSVACCITSLSHSSWKSRDHINNIGGRALATCH